MNYTKDDLEKAYKTGATQYMTSISQLDNYWNEYWESINPLEPGFYKVRVKTIGELSAYGRDYEYAELKAGGTWDILGHSHVVNPDRIEVLDRNKL